MPPDILVLFQNSRVQRCVDNAPHVGSGKITAFLAALRHNTLTALMLIGTSINGELFLALRHELLRPTLLPPCNTVITDNLSSHKVAGVREASEKWTCSFGVYRATRQISIRSNSSLPSLKHCAAPAPARILAR